MLKLRFAIVIFSLVSLRIVADEPAAYRWEHSLTLESISNLQGGLATGTRNLANLDLTLSIDTQSAGWWRNGRMFIYVLGNYGKPPSALIGEAQTISNIETDNNLKLYEFWYEHSFADGAIKLLAGLHDFNSAFYSLESAGLFNVSSMGIGPELAQVGPSIFSTTAVGTLLSLLSEHQYLLLASYDGVAGDPDHRRGTHIKFNQEDGFFNAMEWGLVYEKSFKLALGAWQHSVQRENPVDASLSDSNHGYYLIGEKYFSENLAVFAQYGRADAKQNQIETYLGTGITLSNAWIAEDIVGLAYASARNGAPFTQMNTGLLSAENVWELSYFVPLSTAVSMQTSLYAVEHPSMSPELANALALGLRLYIEF